jgi:hypothetical protein
MPLQIGTPLVSQSFELRYSFIAITLKYDTKIYIKDILISSADGRESAGKPAFLDLLRLSYC